MILDHWAYTGEAIPDFLAIPMGVVEFYANLWGNTTSSAVGSKMVFYPTQALETWQCPGWPVNDTDCPTNDMPTVAGLHSVIEKLLQLPPTLVTPAQVAEWSKIKSTLPPLPAINGSHAPCDNCVLVNDGGHGPGCHRMTNGETAELYSVHPYRQATIARANRSGDGSEWEKANRAFNADPLTKSDQGWNQNVMTAALLGNTTIAAKYLIARARTPLAGGYRFPGFAPRMQDAAPSGDHYAVFSTALQYMLIQRADDAEDSVLLLPAWPCEWDVNFTVSAPKLTTITGSVKDGVLHYTVTPSSRASAVVAGSCQPVAPPPPQPPQPSPSPHPPPAPPGVHCNTTAWKLLCEPMPANVSACMKCCDSHQAELWKLNCIGPDCWPDYCAAKPAPGCQ
jgi:alpha-L-fucosidase 2